MSLDVYLYSECYVEPIDIRLFSANITHNLNTMAYYHLWRPEEIGMATYRTSYRWS